MLIHCVDVSFVLQELLYDITVSVTGCQVQGRVIPTVHDIDSCPSHDQHLNHSRAAFSAGPVQGEKP